MTDKEKIEAFNWIFNYSPIAYHLARTLQREAAKQGIVIRVGDDAVALKHVQADLRRYLYHIVRKTRGKNNVPST